ncbi:MAG: hypothetical protein M3Q03_01345 [Chloroflexota bacterium]|nr:hypothetical protein [Chloroflexota bacterium]
MCRRRGADAGSLTCLRRTVDLPQALEHFGVDRGVVAAVVVDHRVDFRSVSR